MFILYPAVLENTRVVDIPVTAIDATNPNISNRAIRRNKKSNKSNKSDKSEKSNTFDVVEGKANHTDLPFNPTDKHIHPFQGFNEAFLTTVRKQFSNNKYVDGGVHASDGGRIHPSIRGDIFDILNS